MKLNPLQTIEKLGQSIWLDYIKRDLFSGKLASLIHQDNLRGMTSNPSIFEKSISESHEYDKEIRSLAQAGKNVTDIYATLTQKDVGTAADEFLSVYKRTHGQDGFVSLEVNPHLAHDTAGTLAEARELWHALNRPNVMIKVPATTAGLPVIQQLISEGINVNVTLLFGLERYQAVAKAYIAGIETRLARGQAVDHIASVASFFLSRIDVLLDPILEQKAQDAKYAKLATQYQGQIAIAAAKNAYRIYQDMFNSPQFTQCAHKGARSQRLLWASTGTKNPNYSDVKYVEALIGPYTVNTLPVETFDAYRDHGKPELRLTHDMIEAQKCFNKLPELGIDMQRVTQQLEDEGVDKFVKSYDQLIDALKIHLVKNS